jgi:hypothetical protein
VKPARACKLLLAGALTAGAVAVAAGPAEAARGIQYGVQDDAWLLYGRGSVDSRVELLGRMGVDIVRFTIRWDVVARRRPASPRDHRSPAYDWRTVDPALDGLRRGGIDAAVTLLGTPAWANGGREPNWAPRGERAFANFAYAAARRFPWVRKWTIWNEPNQARWLRPTSPGLYVRRLLNPAYGELHAAIPGVRVAGGVTAPRAGQGGGRSPVAWIRGMGAAGALLDAYAHHPYPLRPRAETPWQGGCAHCTTITMADLERLVREVRGSFGPTRIWLTEYGYQTDPPDSTLGVSQAAQARYVASAARRAYLAPMVDMLVHFLVRDETRAEGWQSGVFTARGLPKAAYWTFRMPVTQTRTGGDRVELWGQIRPRSGQQPYRVSVYDGTRWRRVGGALRTDERGFFSVTVRVPRRAILYVWSPRDRRYSLALT